ncbi:hypothetical protein [Naasia lichenicola]|uniref:Uncharacterized protein n=1 Tax=Naasia lichenicola TaxID=2565933 RepID=A0A4V3WTQ2_9MICO|nr:hypothetical protein [Naasia lichenicola]THG32837.1 hypothetical protein E6C64_00180 [Naasia lichenicola]
MTKRQRIIVGSSVAIMAAVAGGLAIGLPAQASSVSTTNTVSTTGAVEDGTADGETADDQGIEDGTADGETADDQGIEDGTADGETADDTPATPAG